MRRTAQLAVILFIAQISWLPVQADTTVNQDEPVKSMGLPSKYEFYLAPMLVIDREDSGTDWGGHLLGGIYRHLANPNLGLGLTGEGYLGAVAGELDSGVRLLGVAKFPFLQAGIDHSFRHHESDFILSLVFPAKRGGLFGIGDSIRIDWLPGRDNSFNVGFSFPIGNRYLGKTRNKQDQVALPVNSKMPVVQKLGVNKPELDALLDQIRHAAVWIKIYTTPFFDQELAKDEDELAEFHTKVSEIKAHINLADQRYPKGHTYYAEVLTYHQALDQAILSACGLSQDAADDQQQARRIADQLRLVLLDEVIVPYNRLLGRSKKNDSLSGYGEQARNHFKSWLDQKTLLSSSQKRALL